MIDVSRAEERVRALIGRGAGWDCFSFFGPYHLSDPAGIGMSLPNGVEKNGLRMLGIPAPFAGGEANVRLSEVIVGLSVGWHLEP